MTSKQMDEESQGNSELDWEIFDVLCRDMNVRLCAVYVIEIVCWRCCLIGNGSVAVDGFERIRRMSSGRGETPILKSSSSRASWHE